MPGVNAGLVSDVSPRAADAELPAAPLSGVRVIEVGRFAAGPACATVLADWGADVIKIEPPGGDPARGRGVIEGGDARRLLQRGMPGPGGIQRGAAVQH